MAVGISTAAAAVSEDSSSSLSTGGSFTIISPTPEKNKRAGVEIGVFSGQRGRVDI